MKYILLVVGQSGSGKTSIVKELCRKYGYKELVSYTDRPKRYEDEDCHIFITKEEADRMYLEEKIVAYTVFDGHQYFCTEKQVEESDIYVIDPEGMDDFLRNYEGSKPIYSIYIEATREERVERMLKRGDNAYDIQRRVDHDDKVFNRTIVVSAKVRNKNFKRAVKVMKRWMSFFEFQERIRELRDH